MNSHDLYGLPVSSDSNYETSGSRGFLTFLLTPAKVRDDTVAIQLLAVHPFTRADPK